MTDANADKSSRPRTSLKALLPLCKPAPATRPTDIDKLLATQIARPAPPAGKRLVLEHATLHIALWADQSVACELSGTVASVQGTQAAVHHFGPAQLVYATHSDSYFRINQPLRFYVDAAGRDGLPLAIHCHRQGPAMKPWPVTATLTGYLMDQPAQ